MSLSDNYVPIKQIGNGSTTVFTGSWKVFNATYLDVFLEDTTTGVQTLQTEGTDYTLTFNDSGFTVTFTTAPSSSDYVVIGRSVDREQPTIYKTSKGYQGKTHENSYDRIVAMIQELQDETDRAIKFPLANTNTNRSFPTPIEGYLLEWDANGNLINGAKASTLVPGTSGIVTIDQYGAAGDGSTDDTTAFQQAALSGKTVFVTEGTYVINDTVPFASNTSFVLLNATLNIDVDGTSNRGLLMSGVSNCWILGSGVINHNLSADAGSDGSYNGAVTFGEEFYWTTVPTRTYRCGVIGDIKLNSTGTLNSKSISINGYSEDIYLDGLEITGRQNFALTAHWTRDGTAGNLPTKTYHPHNLYINNVTIKDDGSNTLLRGYRLSACGRVIGTNVKVLDTTTIAFSLFVGDYGFTYSQNVDDEAALDYVLNNCIAESDGGGLLSMDGISSGLDSSAIWSGCDHNAKLTLNNFKGIMKDGGDADAIAIQGVKSLIGHIEFVEEQTGNTNNPFLLTSVVNTNITGYIKAQEEFLIRDCDFVKLDGFKAERVAETHDATSENISFVANSTTTTIDGAISVGDTSVTIDSTSLNIAAGGILQYDDGGTLHEMEIKSTVFATYALTFTIDPSTVAIPDGATVTLIQTIRNAEINVQCSGSRVGVKVDGSSTAKPRNINIKGKFTRCGVADIDMEYVDGFSVDISSDHGGKTTTTTTTYGVLAQDGAENGSIKARYGKYSKGVKFPVYCDNACGLVTIDSCVFPVAGSTAGTTPITIGTSGNVTVGNNNAYGSGVEALYNRIEGSWTPAYEAASGSPTITMGSVEGKYVKEGRKVKLWGRVQTTAFTAAGSADMRITGMPFTAINTSGLQFTGTVVRANDFQANSNPSGIYVNENTDNIIMTKNAGSDARSETNVVISETDMGTGSSDNELQFYIEYLTDE